MRAAKAPMPTSEAMRCNSDLSMTRRGFSLLELVAVTALLALIVAAVAIRLHGPQQQAQMQDVVSQIAAYDRLTRSIAEQKDRSLVLVIDLTAGKLRRLDGQEPAGGEMTLPAGYRIDSARVGQDRFSGGSVPITFGPMGISNSYALLVTAPSGQQRWLLLAGLSGQITVIETAKDSDAKAVADILAQTAPLGRDAR